LILGDAGWICNFPIKFLALAAAKLEARNVDKNLQTELSKPILKNVTNIDSATKVLEK